MFPKSIINKNDFVYFVITEKNSTAENGTAKNGMEKMEW
jgi:hypothetical protein